MANFIFLGPPPSTPFLAQLGHSNEIRYYHSTFSQQVNTLPASEKPMKIAFWALSWTCPGHCPGHHGGCPDTVPTAPMVFRTMPGHFGTMCRTKFSAQCSVHLELYIAGPKFDSPRGQGKLRAEVLPTIQPTFQHSFQLTFQPTSQGEATIFLLLRGERS